MNPILGLTPAILLTAAGPLLAQAPSGPAKIAVGAPLMAPMSTPSKVDITLQDARGKPAAADRDIQLRVFKPGVTAPEIVTVLKGSSSAQVSVVGKHAGLGEVSVEPVNTTSHILSATSEIGFAPEQAYTPVLPLNLTLSVSPRSQLFAGADTGKVVARLLDSRGIPTAATHDISVMFPEVSEWLEPHMLRIAAGSAVGSVTISSSAAGKLVLAPVVEPPSFRGSPIGTQRLDIEFVNQIVALRLLADPRYAKAFSRPEFTVKAGLIDAQGNWIASDNDRTIVLRVEPPAAGRLREGELTIKRGTSVAQTSYMPNDEGVAKLSALGSGLQVQDDQIHFSYAWTYFIMFAALFGFFGGVTKQALKGKWDLKQFIIGAVVGTACGVLAYVLAPLIVTLSFKPEQLKNASKLFEAIAWGFVGGGGGPALLGRVFPSDGSGK